MYRKLNVIWLCLICALLSACQKSDSKTVSSTTKAVAPDVSKTTEASLPPSPEDLRKVIRRTYQDAVTVDSSRSDQFLTGDFNGDGSQDIAIVVKPGKGKLAELNSEYGNWILEDPQQIKPPSGASSPTKPARAVIRMTDVLLAVIHGHERIGWRDRSATQTYLLTNAVGQELEARPATSLNTRNEKRLPQLSGDVIREKLDGKPGIIFWTGAKYAWHPMS